MTQRLKSNTPNKWKNQNSAVDGLKTFILVSLLAFSVLATLFLIAYLAKPLEVRVFIRDLGEWISK